MVLPFLKLPPVILGSKSPRRQELLAQMGIDFVVAHRDVDESYPGDLPPESVAIYIAEKKMQAFTAEREESLVITADTVVIAAGEILGKPKDRTDAQRMLKLISGTPQKPMTHTVMTGISLAYKTFECSFVDTTVVYFNEIKPEEADYYIDTFEPYDKAGAYGIQEWIGLNKLIYIEGSYSNVVGLPTRMLYDYLAMSQERLEHLKIPRPEGVSVELYPPDFNAG